MRIRDTQRAKLYAADDVLEPFAKPLPEHSDVQEFVRRVWSSKRLRKEYPKAFKGRKPKVRNRGNRSEAATGGYWEISIPVWARKTNVVLHELAHVIVHRSFPGAAGHGWEFTSVFLRLVRLYMGKEAHDAFKRSMKGGGVKFRAPRKRAPMPEHAKAELIARLNAGRARKIKQDYDDLKIGYDTAVLMLKKIGLEGTADDILHPVQLAA